MGNEDRSVLCGKNHCGWVGAWTFRRVALHVHDLVSVLTISFSAQILCPSILYITDGAVKTSLTIALWAHMSCMNALVGASVSFLQLSLARHIKRNALPLGPAALHNVNVNAQNEARKMFLGAHRLRVQAISNGVIYIICKRTLVHIHHCFTEGIAR